MMEPETLIREIQKGLLQWYDFVPVTGRDGGMASERKPYILYIGNEKDSMAEMFVQLHFQVICVSCEQTSDVNWQQDWEENFDYIISIKTLEQQSSPERFLAIWRKLLKPQGRMLLGMNNRFGIRYFCGDRDPYTGRNFDGIENYRRAYFNKEDTFQGSMYSCAEIKQMLQDNGWFSIRFFSVFPDLENSSLIYSEDYLPNEDLATRLVATYNYPDSVFLEEESLYASLAENGLFHCMANAYLIECSLNGEHSDVLHVTSSMERGREDAFFTVIRKSGVVEKRAVYPEGLERLVKLAEHGRDLASHGVRVVEAKVEDGIYVMPYINAEGGQVHLKKLLRTDMERFLQELDDFRDLILRSSEIVEPDRGDGEGVILRKGYWDLIPLNSFYRDGTFVIYDQEFCQDYFPANAIIARMVATVYSGNEELQKLLPAKALYERYGLTAKLAEWDQMAWTFLIKLRKERELRCYHERYRRNVETVNANRQRINYSDEDYQRLFIDIFRDTDKRKLILFGSGAYAKKFLALYQRDYPVHAIIDNNSEKWGQELEGVAIQSPALLGQLRSDEYKVLICIKNYLSVVKQLDAMGVREYCIYDSGKSYPTKYRPVEENRFWGSGERPESGESQSRKYHIGYIAGVFDLFHIGHLNMFRRAKEQCDYLIVGVVTDEGVRKYKEVDPFIPFEERIELVRSCRYVDEAVEIPVDYNGTRDAWRLYHFDCQFSGSDYVNNPDWLAEKEFLRKHGAEMVFFPYTESTSSTRIKSLIEKKLM